MTQDQNGLKHHRRNQGNEVSPLFVSFCSYRHRAGSEPAFQNIEHSTLNNGDRLEALSYVMRQSVWLNPVTQSPPYSCRWRNLGEICDMACSVSCWMAFARPAGFGTGGVGAHWAAWAWAVCWHAEALVAGCRAGRNVASRCEAPDWSLFASDTGQTGLDQRLLTALSKLACTSFWRAVPFLIRQVGVGKLTRLFIDLSPGQGRPSSSVGLNPGRLPAQSATSDSRSCSSPVHWRQ